MSEMFFVEKKMNYLRQKFPMLMKNINTLLKQNTEDEFEKVVGEYNVVAFKKGDDVVAHEDIDFWQYKMLKDWQEHKVQYKLNDSLGELLFDQTKAVCERANNTNSDDDLPTEALIHLPYNSVAVAVDGVNITFEIPNNTLKVLGVARKEFNFSFDGGFLATVADEGDYKVLKIRWLMNNVKMGDLTSNYELKTCLSQIKLKKGLTFRDAIEECRSKSVYQTLIETCGRLHKVSEQEWFVANAIGTINYCLEMYAVQILLYIGAQNADVETVVNVSAVRSKGKKKITRTCVKEIGYNIGTLIKRSRRYIKQEGVEGSAKRPHSRRGHWHHYWIGKRNSEERQLVWKWLAPMFINGKADKPTLVNVK